MSQNNSFDKRNPLYKASKESICKFFGDFLLETNPKYQLQEFLQIWQKAVPGGEDPKLCSNSLDDPVFKVHLDHEKGEIKRFPEWSLPVEIQDRLHVLFLERE